MATDPDRCTLYCITSSPQVNLNFSPPVIANLPTPVLLYITWLDSAQVSGHLFLHETLICISFA